MSELTEERGKDYGPPEENHWRTARLWEAYLELRREEHGGWDSLDVCALNMLQKLARSMHREGDHRDTWLDIAGYSHNALEILEKNAKK